MAGDGAELFWFSTSPLTCLLLRILAYFRRISAWVCAMSTCSLLSFLLWQDKTFFKRIFDTVFEVESALAASETLNGAVRGRMLLLLDSQCEFDIHPFTLFIRFEFLRTPF